MSKTLGRWKQILAFALSAGYDIVPRNIRQLHTRYLRIIARYLTSTETNEYVNRRLRANLKNKTKKNG